MTESFCQTALLQFMNLFRAFPMVSSLIGPQYHDDKFWKFAQSAEEGTPNNFDVEVVPEFSADFEVNIQIFLYCLMIMFTMLT